jgi:hypothetical protein
MICWICRLWHDFGCLGMQHFWVYQEIVAWFAGLCRPCHDFGCIRLCMALLGWSEGCSKICWIRLWHYWVDQRVVAWFPGLCRLWLNLAVSWLSGQIVAQVFGPACGWKHYSMVGRIKPLLLAESPFIMICYRLCCNRQPELYCTVLYCDWLFRAFCSVYNPGPGLYITLLPASISVNWGI